MTYCHGWGSHRVYFHDGAGRLRKIPAGWTDVVAEDPFVIVSAGRSAFRVADLLMLADLIEALKPRRRRRGSLSGTLFKGVFFTVQKALPHMRDGASIILVGSADGDKQGRVGTSIYTASKSAVRSLARSLSVELLPRKIRVNVLSPGMTETPIITREGGLPGMTPEELASMITKTIPLGRRGTPEEMAKAMLFLASDDSTYCLGSELLVDGGLPRLVNP